MNREDPKKKEPIAREHDGQDQERPGLGRVALVRRLVGHLRGGPLLAVRFGRRDPLLSRLVLMALLLAFVVLVLHLVKIHDPSLILDAKSESVTFVPQETVELVQKARPLHGLDQDRTPFTSIRLRSGYSPEDLALALSPDFTPDLPGSRMFESRINHLEVTADCAVRLRAIGGDWISLEIVPAQVEFEGYNPDGGCFISAEVSGGESPWPIEVEHDDSLKATEPIVVQFEPTDPLRFQRIAVSRLGFMVRTTRAPTTSGIIAATIRLPDFGGATESLGVGDGLRLGETQGQIVELAVEEEGLRTRFKGQASEPEIDRNPTGLNLFDLTDLRPSILRYFFHQEGFKFAIGIVVGIIALVLAYLEVKRE